VQGGSSEAETCLIGAFCMEKDLPPGRRGWEEPDQALGTSTGPLGYQYGSLFRKRENMMKAAWGLSVGTMCPAPWGAKVVRFLSPPSASWKTLTPSFQTLYSFYLPLPENFPLQGPLVTQNKKKPESKDGWVLSLPLWTSYHSPGVVPGPTLIVRKVMWENSFTKPAICSPLSP
jgi:hypothetical protein